MTFNKHLLQKHPVIKTYLQWRKKELQGNTKEKALEILQPYVDKVVEETKFKEKQKEQVVVTINQQTNIYEKHKQLINEIS